MIKNIFFVLFLISNLAFAQKIGPGFFGPNKIPDQYQCADRKNADVVGILSDTNEYLLQAVATSDRSGVREVSGVISDQIALMNIKSKEFLSQLKMMPPINGEGGMKNIPQGTVWTGVAQTSIIANQYFEKPPKAIQGANGSYTVGSFTIGASGSSATQCTDITCSAPSFGSAFGGKGWDQQVQAAITDYEEKKKDREKFHAEFKELKKDIEKYEKDKATATAVATAVALKYPAPDPNDMRPGGRAAREKLPGQIAAATSRPGDEAAKTKRPGDLVAERPGDIAAKAERPGDTVGERVGDKAAYEIRPGDQAHFERMLKKAIPRLGENIGEEGITTFTALYDAQGNLTKVVYRSGRDITKTILASDKNASSDPIIAKLKAQTKRFQTYASCCKNDSRKECVIKHEPEIKPSVAPPSTIPRDHGPGEPGGAMFNPFGGSR